MELQSRHFEFIQKQIDSMILMHMHASAPMVNTAFEDNLD
jgi:hypothetical protein